MDQCIPPLPSDESRTTLGRRSFSAGLVSLLATSEAAVVHARHARAATEHPRVVGAYSQLTADGEYVGLGMEGVEHALAAFAAMYKVTRSAHQRVILEALVDRVLEASPTYMGHLFGVQVLSDPFLLSHPRLRDNVHRYATSLVERFAANPDQLLRTGDIRTLTGNVSFLIAYARFRERDASKLSEDLPTVEDVDAVTLALLNRVVELQLTLSAATSRFGNPRLAGGFPHLVEGPDGSMGSWDVRTWSPVMLSLDQYAAVRALAEGFGRYRHPLYRRAAAAGARLLLATTEIDPNLVYAGEPPGFPLDGAELAFGEETGEMPYAITYGWSPNAVANLGTALHALLVNRVTVPRSRTWTKVYWRGRRRRRFLTRGRSGRDSRPRSPSRTASSKPPSSRYRLTFRGSTFRGRPTRETATTTCGAAAGTTARDEARCPRCTRESNSPATSRAEAATPRCCCAPAVGGSRCWCGSDPPSPRPRTRECGSRN